MLALRLRMRCGEFSVAKERDSDGQVREGAEKGSALLGFKDCSYDRTGTFGSVKHLRWTVHAFANESVQNFA